MPTQRSVAVRFWTSLSLLGCSPHSRLVMLNCMTGPRSNIAGFFRLSLDDCCLETGLTRRQIVEALQEARQREFLEWDTQTLWVWVRKRVCFEFPDGTLSAKQLRGIVRILDDAPDTQLKSMFVEFYKGFIKGFPNGLCKPTGSGSLLPASGSLLPAPTPISPEEEEEPPIVPRGTDGFEQFYDRYPRKQGKKAARKAWKKLAPDNELVETILTAVMLQASSDAWTKDGGQFIPHPATWLNGRRWEDEVLPPTLQLPKSTQQNLAAFDQWREMGRGKK